MSPSAFHRRLRHLLLIGLIISGGAAVYGVGEESGPSRAGQFEAVTEGQRQSSTPRAKRGKAYLRSCVCWRCQTLNFGPPNLEKFTCKKCGHAYSTKDGRVLEVDATEAEVLLRERERIEEDARLRAPSQPSETGPRPVPLPPPPTGAAPDPRPVFPNVAPPMPEPPPATPGPRKNPIRPNTATPAREPEVASTAPGSAPTPALPAPPVPVPVVAATPAPATPSPDTPAGIDALLDKLAAGALAFNAPESLALQEAGVIQLLLSPSLTKEQLAALIREPGAVKTATLKISSSMEAKLTSGPVFSIQAISPEEQMISQAEPTEWRWNVTPLQPGKHRLHLVVNAIVKVGESEKRRMLKTFDREIQVMVPAQAIVPANPLVRYAVPAGIGLFVLGAAVAGWCVWIRQKRASALTPSAPAADCEVFVSYARHDLARVQPLVSRLQERGIKVWLDVEGIDGATVWAGEIAQAIQSSRAVVLMASRAAFGSEYVRREISLAADEHKPIVPLYLEEAEIPAPLKLSLAGIQQISLDRAGHAEGFDALVRALARLGVPPPDESAETEAM